MKTMPSPVDLRIWLLSRVLGWPQRRIASEVGVSQSTVVRTLDQLQNDPPTDQEMQEFVTVGTTTPPNGLPLLKAKRKRRDASLLTVVAAVSILMIAVAVTVVLISLAVSILSHLHPLTVAERDRGVHHAVDLRGFGVPPVIPAGTGA